MQQNTPHLLKLFCHAANDLSVFHGGLHVGGDLALTAGSINEELHQLQQGGISVLLV